MRWIDHTDILTKSCIEQQHGYSALLAYHVRNTKKAAFLLCRRLQQSWSVQSGPEEISDPRSRRATDLILRLDSDRLSLTGNKAGGDLIAIPDTISKSAAIKPGSRPSQQIKQTCTRQYTQIRVRFSLSINSTHLLRALEYLESI